MCIINKIRFIASVVIYIPNFKSYNKAYYVGFRYEFG